MMDAATFDVLAKPVRMSPPIRQALREVMVYGLQWRVAARRNHVTESGISRAARRMHQAHQRCPACGQKMPAGTHAGPG